MFLFFKFPLCVTNQTQPCADVLNVSTIRTRSCVYLFGQRKFVALNVWCSVVNHFLSHFQFFCVLKFKEVMGIILNSVFTVYIQGILLKLCILVFFSSS